jgi:dTDP-4-dehydrorhamnose reductase
VTCKVLVIGRTGQMARALQSISSAALTYEAVGRPEIDMTRPETMAAAIDSHRPAIVINAAAYTAVDLAESEPETAELINAVAPGILANFCNTAGIPLIHLSTDYVFDGAADRPLAVDNPVNPRNVYGSSKAAGERAVRANLPQHIIVRLAWLYDERGRNFLNTILRLARERTTIDVVNDQTGCPTYTSDAALALDRIAQRVTTSVPSWGTYHLTNEGSATWFAFACAILREAERFGHPQAAIRPISSDEYPTKAYRPRYSVLDNSLTLEHFGVRLPHWEDGLARCVRSKFASAPISRVAVQ